MAINLPALLSRNELRNACIETAKYKNLNSWIVEKDYYLSRLIWAIVEEGGENFFLKGGTCLSKCYLDFHRMSEDIDFTIPWDQSFENITSNKIQLEKFARILTKINSSTEFQLLIRKTKFSELQDYGSWTFEYPSIFIASQYGSIRIETSLHPVKLPHKKTFAHLLLKGEQFKDYENAFCYSLDYEEIRAEKVRTAFTRRAIRDYYDLDVLYKNKEDMSSSKFINLVDQKLAEYDEAPGNRPLKEQSRSFGLSKKEVEELKDSIIPRLEPMLRTFQPMFDLDKTIANYNVLWGKELELE
jgi:predicted nucleotidyltransferase component of viral defense system